MKMILEMQCRKLQKSILEMKVSLSEIRKLKEHGRIFV